MNTGSDLDQKSANFKSRIVLSMILFIGFILRIWGLDFGLPFSFHADEPIIVHHALAYGTLDFNPHFFKIPPLTSYLLFAVYALYYVLGKLVGFFPNALAFQNLFFDNPSSFYLIGRFFIGVVPAIFSIYFIYRLGQKVSNTFTGLLASLMLSLCFLHARDSHFIYTDILLCTFLIAAFNRLEDINTRPLNWRCHIMFSILAGVCIAIKYNGVFILIPYIFLLYNRLGISKSWLHIAVAFAIACFIFLLLNPFAFLDFPFFISEINAQKAAQGGIPFFHHLIYSLPGALGLPLYFMSLIACFINLLFSKGTIKSAAFFCIAYYLVIAQAGQPYDRYVLPLLPFLILNTAYLLNTLMARGGKRPALLLGVITILMSIPSTIAIVRCNQILAAEDIRIEAKQWILNNIPPQSKIALGIKIYCPPLDAAESQLKDKLTQIRNEGGQGAQIQRLERMIDRQKRNKDGYELFYLSRNPDQNAFLFSRPSIAYSIEALRNHSIEYVILPILNDESREAVFIKEIAREADLIKEFSPYFEARRVTPFDNLALTGAPFLWDELIHRRANGISLRVYKMKEHS